MLRGCVGRRLKLLTDELLVKFQATMELGGIARRARAMPSPSRRRHAAARVKFACSDDFNRIHADPEYLDGMARVWLLDSRGFAFGHDEVGLGATAGLSSSAVLPVDVATWFGLQRRLGSSRNS